MAITWVGRSVVTAERQQGVGEGPSCAILVVVVPRRVCSLLIGHRIHGHAFLDRLGYSDSVERLRFHGQRILVEKDEVLRDVMSVWTSKQWGYATRVTMLSDVLIPGDTVQNDHDRDILIGSSGRDWLFYEFGRDRALGGRR